MNQLTKPKTLKMAALAIIAYSSSSIAELSIPPIPTTVPTIPTTVPSIPSTGPAIPTSVPPIPSTIPSLPVVTPTYIYSFSGFRAPIRTNGTTNTSRGKSIRFGWNLSDKSGATITNPAVVVDRFYKQIDCNTDSAVSGPNPAGIRLSPTIWSKGRKDLEFSWKTPNLRKSCLLFTIVFDDTQTASAKFFVK